MTTKSFFLTMSDGQEICVNQWLPDDEPKALILITHGMAEHSLRYDRTASFFVDEGFAVCAYDVRGHGKTATKQLANGQPGFGYLADKDGYKKVVEDIKTISDNFKNNFPNKKLFLVSHSFGSMLTQSYIQKYSSEIDGCILCGTSGPMQATVKAGLVLAKLLCFFGLKRKPSKLLDNMTFGSYCKKIKKPRTKYDWLTKNEFVVDMYIADKWCGYIMTTLFFKDLLKLLSTTHKKSNIKKVSNDLPIFMIAGTEDPVGKYGKTVTNLYNIYKSNGVKDINLKLYKDDRHELFNETDSDVVIKDIVEWIKNRV